MAESIAFALVGAVTSLLAIEVGFREGVRRTRQEAADTLACAMIQAYEVADDINPFAGVCVARVATRFGVRIED